MGEIIVSWAICGILLFLSFSLAFVLIVYRHEYFKAIKEIDSLKKLNEEMKNSAITDHLTRLFNRRQLFQTLEAEMLRARRYKHSTQIMFIDVDDFQEFNNRFGHRTGDKVLSQIAEILQSCVRKYDMAARYGGDEFMLILPEISLELSIKAAERILKEIKNLEVGDGSVKISVSIGICQIDVHNDIDPLEAADAAMYAAKKNGKGRISVSHPNPSWIS